MRYRKLWLLAFALLWCSTAFAQQQPAQPLTFWATYAVKPGKEADFLDLVKTVGQPVRDKMMADGVILAWGLENSLLRGQNGNSHAVWYAVADWASIEKVQNAFNAQLAKIAADEAKAGEKKGQKSTADRIRDVIDSEKTKDYVTRDVVFVVGTSMPAGVLPYTRYNFVKVKPGKGDAYRATWEKYNKPVLDKLVADGTILAFGLGVEDVKTTGDFTHFTWYAVKNAGDLDKVRSTFLADRERRTAEEREAITAAFLGEIDPDASRSEVDHSLIFHVPGPK